MGLAFCQPNMTPVLPSCFACRMSLTEVACCSVSLRSRILLIQVEILSIASPYFSNMAMVALIAATPPEWRLWYTAGLSQLLTFSPSTTTDSL